MVCEENETDIDIGIPAVMLPQDVGTNMEKHIKNNSIGMIYFYCIYLLFCNWLCLLVGNRILILKYFLNK